MVNALNSSPQCVVDASNTNTFKACLDKFSSNQDHNLLIYSVLRGLGMNSILAIFHAMGI